MRALVAMAAFAGFFTSAVSHGFAMAGRPLFESKWMFFALHAGVLVVFLSAMAVFRKMAGRPRSLADLSLLPAWTRVLILALLFYALFNFANATLPDGTAERQGEGFVLRMKGGEVREVTQSEFKAAQAGLIRTFSGHWMFFYATAGLLMLARKPGGEV